MSDATTPVEGKDVSVELVVDGVPMLVTDQVTRFTEKPTYDTIETKPLGTTEVDIDKVPTGWSGEITFSRRTKALDDLIDAWNLARRARVPVLVNITRTTRYRDGTTKTHTYIDVKIEFSTEASRGSAVSSTMPWVSGRDRI